MGAWFGIALTRMTVRAHDAFGERSRRNEKCPDNLLHGQAPDFAQGERNLSVRKIQAAGSAEQGRLNHGQQNWDLIV